MWVELEHKLRAYADIKASSLVLRLLTKAVGLDNREAVVGSCKVRHGCLNMNYGSIQAAKLSPGLCLGRPCMFDKCSPVNR